MKCKSLSHLCMYLLVYIFPECINTIYEINFMLSCPCNVDPLTSHFHIVKLWFTRVYIIFIFLLLSIDCDCGYSLKPPK